MKVSIVCSNDRHPVYPKLVDWARARAAHHQVELVDSSAKLTGGDILFLISCAEFIGPGVRARYRHTLVVHASALPQGRGWSPHVWQILEGKHTIPVSLLEAEDKIDSGRIWSERTFELEGHELFDEINAKLFAATLDLMDFALANASTVVPRDQGSATPTYYRKRTPDDSRLDPNKSIAEQFDLLRVADPDRFPCFIDHRGRRYRVILQKDSAQ
jgi:methionyl-tRNA formyltransferase